MAVDVDFEPHTDLPALAATEIKKQRGHDIFGFLSPPARIRQDQVIDHAAIVHQVKKEVRAIRQDREAKSHVQTRRRSVTSASRTTTSPHHSSGATTSGTRSASRPRRWDHVREAGAALKEDGASSSESDGQNDPDSNMHVDLVLDVLRRIPAGRVRRRCDRQRADDRGGPKFMADLQARGRREHGLSTGTRPPTTSSFSRAKGSTGSSNAISPNSKRQRISA